MNFLHQKIVITGCLLIMYCATTSCVPKMSASTDTFLIPNGYKGWVRIIYGVKGAPALKVSQHHRINIIPGSGVLKTSSSPLSGWSANEDEFYYYIGSKHTKIHFWKGPSPVMIRENAIESAGQPAVISEKIFIGSEEEADKVPPSKLGPLK